MTDRDKFNRFTERARKVLSLAQEEAQRFQHNYIGTEHLLLELLREGEGIAAGVLESLGVNLEQARRQTLAVLDDGGQGGVQEPRPEEAEGNEIPDQDKDRAINLEPLQDEDDR